MELTARPQVPSRSLTQEPPPQLPPAPHPMPPAPKHEFQSRRQRLFLPVFVCTTRLLGALRSLLARAWPPAPSLASKPCSLPSRFGPELCSEPTRDGTWLCPPLCVSRPAPGGRSRSCDQPGGVCAPGCHSCKGQCRRRGRGGLFIFNLSTSFWLFFFFFSAVDMRINPDNHAGTHGNNQLCNRVASPCHRPLSLSCHRSSPRPWEHSGLS